MTSDDQDYTPYSLQDDDQTTAQQLASLVSPAAPASLVPPDIASTGPVNTSSAPAAVMQPPSPAQPGASAQPVTAAQPAMAAQPVTAAQPAMAAQPAAQPTPDMSSSGRAALAAIGAPPQLDMSRMQQLQSQRNTDAMPLDRTNPKYRVGLAQRILRGVAATLTGGIPAAITTNYGAPNRQYGIDDQARQARLGQDTSRIGDLEKNYEDSVKGYKDATSYATAVNAADRNQNTQNKNDAQHTAFLAQHGLKDVTDAQGNTTTVDDPDSEAFKGRKVMDDLRQTTETLRQAQADAASGDPKTPAGQLAIKKLNAAMAGHSAAQERADAYMGNYRMHALGVDMSGNTLPGATELPDNTPVGTALQSTVQKQQPKVAMFNDVFGSLDSLDNAAKKLEQSGGSIHSPRIAAALADPQGTSAQYLQGLVAKGQLTPQERDYVINNASAHENLMALRSSVGGGISDSQVHQLLSLLPNASTPDLDYALRQTGQIRATANRLGSGIANVHGGTRVRGSQPEAPAAPVGGGQIPASAAAQLQEGVAHTFGNGQTWTKRNGKPVRLK